MSHRSAGGGIGGPIIMLLSAAIFGYFGFMPTFITQGTGGQYLLFVAIYEWTLKIAAVSFFISALLTLARPLEGNLLYAVVGLLSAIALILVAVLDFFDKQHTVAPQFLLWVFAAWNGYGALMGLREVAANWYGGAGGGKDADR